MFDVIFSLACHAQSEFQRYCPLWYFLGNDLAWQNLEVFRCLKVLMDSLADSWQHDDNS